MHFLYNIGYECSFKCDINVPSNYDISLIIGHHMLLRRIFHIKKASDYLFY